MLPLCFTTTLQPSNSKQPTLTSLPTLPTTMCSLPSRLHSSLGPALVETNLLCGMMRTSCILLPHTHHIHISHFACLLPFIQVSHLTSLPTLEQGLLGWAVEPVGRQVRQAWRQGQGLGPGRQHEAGRQAGQWVGLGTFGSSFSPAL